MYEYTHSHLSYDEIIIEDEQAQPVTSTAIQRTLRRYKPFQIEKSKNQTTKAITEVSIKDQQKSNKYSNAKQQQALNPETYEFQQSIEEPVQAEQPQSIVYNSDFELYSEQQQHCDKTETKVKSKLHKLNLSELNKTRKAHNYSAVLPKIGKLHAQDKSHSIDRYHKEQSMEYVCRSTDQLRDENKKLVRSIEQLRKMLPAARKNVELINQQSSQIRQQMKLKQSKFFDVDYQLGLEKNVDRKSIRIDAATDRIREVESLIKFRNKFKRRKQVKANRAEQILLEQEDEESIHHEYSRVREQVLCQKREEQNYSKKVQQLNDKVAQYQQIIMGLDERAQVGYHEDLKRHKVVLQYDIQMAKTRISTQQTKLMLEIAELNNSNSQVEVRLAKTNSELASILMLNNTNNNGKKAMGVEVSRIQIPTPQRNMHKIIRLFGRRN